MCKLKQDFCVTLSLALVELRQVCLMALYWTLQCASVGERQCFVSGYLQKTVRFRTERAGTIWTDCSVSDSST